MIGQRVTLTKVPAYREDGSRFLASGEWDVEDYQPYEPSAYAFEPYYTLTDPHTLLWITVSADVLEDAVTVQ